MISYEGIPHSIEPTTQEIVESWIEQVNREHVLARRVRMLKEGRRIKRIK